MPAAALTRSTSLPSFQTLSSRVEAIELREDGLERGRGRGRIRRQRLQLQLRAHREADAFGQPIAIRVGRDHIQVNQPNSATSARGVARRIRTSGAG